MTPKEIPGTLPGPLYVVFDGPPSHEAPRFVELEDAGGAGHGSDVGVGWDESEEFYRLGPFYSEMQLEGAMGLVRRPLMEALKGLVDATANVIDVGPAYDQAVRVLKAAEEATG